MPRKRARGRGTVGRRTDGKFQARLPNRFGRKAIGVFDDEADAHRHLDVVLAELLNAEGSAELSFAAYGLGVLEEREKTHADARQDQSRWRNHVVGSELGAMALDAVRQVHVRRFYKSLGAKVSERTGRPLSVSLIRSIKSAVRQVFRAAVDAEVIDASPAEGVYLPKYDLTNRAGDHDDSWTYLDAEEIELVDAQLV